MNTTLIARKPFDAPRVLDVGCAVSFSGLPAWEYRVAIASAFKDVEQPLLKEVATRGWVFVSEKQGIFHFKRLKR